MLKIVKEKHVSKTFLTEITSICIVEEPIKPTKDNKFIFIITSNTVDKSTKFDFYDSSFVLLKSVAEILKLSSVNTTKSYYLETTSKS